MRICYFSDVFLEEIGRRRSFRCVRCAWCYIVFSFVSGGRKNAPRSDGWALSHQIGRHSNAFQEEEKTHRDRMAEHYRIRSDGWALSHQIGRHSSAAYGTSGWRSDVSANRFFFFSSLQRWSLIKISSPVKHVLLEAFSFLCVVNYVAPLVQGNWAHVV